MSTLPKNWISEELGNICFTVKGKKPKNSGEKSENRNMPYINIKAFESGKPKEFAELGNYPECTKDDILIVWDGARAGLVGRGVAGYIGSTLSKIYSDALHNSYLYYFLKYQYSYINNNTKGVGIPHVDPNILDSIDVPVAPKNEQKRIVSEIEKQFSRLDEAVDNLKRVKANLKRYKAAVLKAAVEGKLTEKWRSENPDVEPASELLERILTERRKKWEEAELAKMKAKGKLPKDDKWKKRFKDPIRPTVEQLVQIPTTWVWSTVDQLAGAEPNAITDGPFGSNLKTEHYTPVGPRVIRLQNIGYAEFINEHAYISEEHFSRLHKHAVLPNDVIIAALGKPAPRACLVPDFLGKAIVKADCIRFRTAAPHVVPGYVMYALNSEPIQKRTDNVIHGVGRPRLNLKEIKSITLPLPPKKEQAKVHDEIERCWSLAREVELQVEENLVRVERLRQSIVEQAFSGNLVPQDPNDEPAHALMERIEQEKQKEVQSSKKSAALKSSRRVKTVKKSKIKKPLLDVMRKHPDGITPENLLSEANFSVEEVDVFYAQLCEISAYIEQEKPMGNEAFKWPYDLKVILRLREE